MSNESTNLNLNLNDDSDDDDPSDDDSCEDICPECMEQDIQESISESESDIAAFLAQLAANPRPDHRMCGTCKSIVRAIMSLYENRKNEPEGLLMASALLSLQSFHANDAEMMAKDILADVVEQMSNLPD